jgi:hypothetical protein
MFYGNCMNICEDFGHELCRPENWLLHHDNAPAHTSFFTKEIVDHPPYFSLFPRLKIKLKGCHLDTVELVEAKSQAVLNTLTEHDFQNAFENGKSAGNGAYARKGTASRVMVACSPKVSF